MIFLRFRWLGTFLCFCLPAFAQNSFHHFHDAARELGLTVPHISGEKRYIVESVSGGTGLFDCDYDGRLDAVVAGGSNVDRFRKGGYPMVILYHQDANGHFTDITAQAGLTRKGWGMGVAVADFDNDGKLDLFVTGYEGTVLYHNLGNCKFEDVTEKAGLKIGGLTTGAAWADYDRDGNVDLFVSRYVHVDMNDLPAFGSTKFCQFKGAPVQCGPWGMEGETDLLYHNRGDGTFEEVSKKAGVDDPEKYYGLGATWGDYDNDGWPDLFVANGHVYPQMDNVKGSAAYAEPMLLHRNLRNGTFEEVSKAAGLADMPLKSRRGAAFGDIANNGNVDIVVLNVREPPSLLLNTNKIANHRVLFRLVGTKSNRAAIGARVTIHAGGMMQFDEVRIGGSYLSQNDLRLHFGLGSATKIDALEVRWPTGKTETFKDVAPDKIYAITEGQGIKETAALPAPGSISF